MSFTQDVSVPGMAIKVKTHADRLEEDWYKWKVEILGADQERKKIKEVEYILHPTFAKRIFTAKHPEDGFALDGKAYEGFNLIVNLFMRDGSERTLVVPLKMRENERV